jgi:hypothetical protein
MTKPGVCKTAATILLTGCLASNVYLYLALVKTKSSMEDYVPVENYNQLVRAESNNARTFTKAVQADRGRLQQLTQRVAATQARMESAQAQFQQLSAVTNLYEKIGEFELKLSEEDGGMRTFQQKQADSVSYMGIKLAALERAVIKLSLAVQENQFAPPANAVTNTATIAAPNTGTTTNMNGAQ